MKSFAFIVCLICSSACAQLTNLGTGTLIGTGALIGNVPGSGGGGGGATWTLVDHGSAFSPTAGASATATLNTTGSKFLAEVVEWAGGAGSLTVSDGNANTWTASVNYTNNNPKVQVYYVTNATGKVGAGHTFSASCPGSVVVINVYAFSVGSGQPTLDSEAAGARSGNWQATTVSPGSITPSTANNLFITGVAWDVNTATIVTNNANYVSPDVLIFAGNGLRSGFKIHAADSTAENPGWLESPTSNADADAAHISFFLQ